MNEKINTTRLNSFDNLKGLAILLIVLGHMAYLDKFASISFLHDFVFIFHLPIFFFVAGYFSKIDSNQPIKIFKRILIPYIVVTIAIFLFYLTYDKHGLSMFIYPAFGLWFLLALFNMKLFLPIIDKFKYPVLFSLILALSIGFIKYNGDFLGLRRTFVFLPVFLIGFYYRNYKLKIKENYPKIDNILKNNKFTLLVSMIVLLISIVCAWYLPADIIRMKGFYEAPYLTNIILRALIIILGIVITLILNKIMTDKECILTKWGRNSMVIYLIHLFIIRLIKKELTGVLYMQNELVVLLFTFLISFIIVLVLSSDLLTEYYNMAMDKIASLILKSE